MLGYLQAEETTGMIAGHLIVGAHVQSIGGSAKEPPACSALRGFALVHAFPFLSSVDFALGTDVGATVEFVFLNVDTVVLEFLSIVSLIRSVAVGGDDTAVVVRYIIATAADFQVLVISPDIDVVEVSIGNGGVARPLLVDRVTPPIILGVVVGASLVDSVVAAKVLGMVASASLVNTIVTTEILGSVVPAALGGMIVVSAVERIVEIAIGELAIPPTETFLRVVPATILASKSLVPVAVAGRLLHVTMVMMMMPMTTNASKWGRATSTEGDSEVDCHGLNLLELLINTSVAELCNKRVT